MDLKTGESGVLIEPPGRPAIHRLALSRDGAALAYHAIPNMMNQGKRKPPLFQVWNNAALGARLKERS